MLVNVTIPVFNEEVVLRRSVERLAAFLEHSLGHPGQAPAPQRLMRAADGVGRSREGGQSRLTSAATEAGEARIKWEIVIADNASTDGTLGIAGKLSRDHEAVRVLHLDEKGRGRALKRAWRESDAEVLSYMDVDLSTDLGAFPALIASVATGGYDVAIGSRLMKGSLTTRGLKREVISRCYNRLIKVLCHTRFSDAQCGFKAITRRAADELLPWIEDKGWFFDTELLVLAERLGYRVFEQPVRWVDDPDSRVRIWRTAMEDIKGLLRVRRSFASGKYEALKKRRRPEAQNSDHEEKPLSSIRGQPKGMIH